MSDQLKLNLAATLESKLREWGSDENDSIEIITDVFLTFMEVFGYDEEYRLAVLEQCVKHFGQNYRDDLIRNSLEYGISEIKREYEH